MKEITEAYLQLSSTRLQTHTRAQTNTHTHIKFNSIRVYFHQQRNKVFYKVYIYIKLVLQVVKNDNYTVIYGVYITSNSMYNELNNKRKQCILCRITKGNTTDGKE